MKGSGTREATVGPSPSFLPSVSKNSSAVACQSTFNQRLLLSAKAFSRGRRRQGWGGGVGALICQPPADPPRLCFGCFQKERPPRNAKTPFSPGSPNGKGAYLPGLCPPGGRAQGAPEDLMEPPRAGRGAQRGGHHLQPFTSSPKTGRVASAEC